MNMVVVYYLMIVMNKDCFKLKIKAFEKDDKDKPDQHQEEGDKR